MTMMTDRADLCDLKVGQPFFDPVKNAGCVLAFRRELAPMRAPLEMKNTLVYLAYDNDPWIAAMKDGVEMYLPIASVADNGDGLLTMYRQYCREDYREDTNLLRRLMLTDRPPRVEYETHCWWEKPAVVKHLGGLEAMCRRHCKTFPDRCCACDLPMWRAGDRFEDNWGGKGLVVSWQGGTALAVIYDDDTTEQPCTDKWGSWVRKAGPVNVLWHRTRFWELLERPAAQHIQGDPPCD